MKTEVAMASLKLTPNKIRISPSFQVCVLYEDKLDERVMNMMGNMNFISGMGLGKN